MILANLRRPRLARAALCALAAAAGASAAAQSEPTACDPDSPTGTTCLTAGTIVADDTIEVGNDAANDQPDDRLTVTVGSDPLDRGIFVDAPATALSGIDIFKRGPSGNYLRVIGADGRPIAQFGAGGQLETGAWITISRVVSDDGPNRIFVHPTDRPYMLGVWSDVFGPTAVFRSNIYADESGESWPISIINGVGREKLRIDNAGDILFGDISGDDVAGERLQLRLGRSGDAGLLLSRNDPALDPARFLVETGGWYGALDSAGEPVRLISLADGGIAVGDALASATRSMAFGDGAQATHANAVALGAGSATQADNTVAVGAPGNERRITSLADGAAPTDAVNVAQLDALGTRLDEGLAGVDDRLAAIDDGLADHDTRLAAIEAEDGVQGEALANQGQDIAALQDVTAAQGTAIAAIGQTVADHGAQLAVQADAIVDLQSAGAGAALKLTSLATAAGSAEATASGSGAAAFGSAASATGIDALALGTETRASAARATAIGSGSLASGEEAFAGGSFARALGPASVALGSGATATDASAIAQGTNAVASGYGAIATGVDSQATGYQAIAAGVFARAIDSQAMALGRGAFAAGEKAAAIGALAMATGSGATAVGTGASAQRAAATAIGAGARATAANATAIGAGAVSSVDNQVTLGGSGSSVRIGDIAASTAAQTGPVQAVTVDNSGVLGRQAVASAQSVREVGSALEQVAAIGDSQFSALQGDVNTLFDLQQHDRKDFRQGIAAVAAMAEPHFPSESGRTSYASNVAVYRGEVGFSAGLAHRFDGDFALTAGATYAGGKNTAVRAGIAGEF